MLVAGLELSPVKTRARNVELWFYPGTFEDLDGWRRARERARDTPQGEAYHQVTSAAPAGGGLIYVVVDGNLVDLIEARGGPPFQLDNGTHSADPSKPGRYRLGKGRAHQTKNWLYSQIPWGAALREHRGEIEFRRAGSRRWQQATGPASDLEHPLPRHDFYAADGTLMKAWRMNEFGEMAWRLRGSPGLLIHTTPTIEEAAAVGDDPSLSTSHGCLHVKPRQRDRLIERGYLRRGVTVVIKRYRDHLLPRALRRAVTEHRGA